MNNNEWKKVCAACAEGTPPERCAYYGEPNGCNAPKIGQHPTAREELNKAANICLFVKENCGDAQTARYMAEAIVAINEAVAQETAKVEQPGNAAALREALESAHRTLKLVCEHAGEFVQPRLAEEIIHSGAAVERALAAPARNCDRTKDEADSAVKAKFGRPWNTAEDELASWLFAQAEGGAE